MKIISFSNRCICNTLRRRLRATQQKCLRRKQKIITFKGLLRKLKEERLVDADAHELLSTCFSGLTLAVFRNQVRNQTRTPTGRRYSDDIVKFAVTLHFYSPKAYDFVRSFLFLPTARTIRQWASSIDCQPGHLTAVYEYLSKMVEQDPKLKECCLMADEMSIKKDTQWDSAR